ncbi:hypothetical protein BH23CHL7_BH23CHL7_04090 [soil metagenome]
MDLDRQARRQERDETGRPRPQRVPETRPTPLGDWFIYLSIVVLVCGVIAISAIEFGAQWTDPIVRLPVLLGSGVLVVVATDALVRVWRSAWAWLPIDRDRGLFRFVWAAVIAGSIVVALGAFAFVLTA